MTEKVRLVSTEMSSKSLDGGRDLWWQIMLQWTSEWHGETAVRC